MWFSLPRVAHEFISTHDVPFRVAHVDHESVDGEPHVVVTGIAERDDDVLFIKSSRPNRYWELPGGHVEDGEEPTEALKREFKEETGYQVTDSEPIGVLVWAFTDAPLTQIVFTVTLGEKVDEPVQEVEVVEWRESRPDEMSFGESGEKAYEAVMNGEVFSKTSASEADSWWRERSSVSAFIPSTRRVGLALAAASVVAAGVAKRTVFGDSEDN